MTAVPKDTASSRGRALLERLLLAALALASFLASAGAIRAALPTPDLFEGAEKLAYLREHKDEYTALIVGTSALHQALDPRVLDPIVQQVEPEFRSFNLGARGMRAFESDRVLRQALDLMEGRVRWVILELQRFDPALPSHFRERQRTRDWHDLRQSAAAVHVAVDGTLAGRRWSWWIPLHIELYFARLGNVGESERLLHAVTGREPSRDMTVEEIARGHGFISIEDDMGERWPARRKDFLEEKLESYVTAVESLLRNEEVDLLPAEIDALRRQRRFLESRGIAVIYVMPPYAFNAHFARAFAKRGEVPRLANYLDPEQFPQFYDVAARMDPEHLTEAAAQEWTRDVAARIVEMLRSGE